MDPIVPRETDSARRSRSERAVAAGSATTGSCAPFAGTFSPCWPRNLLLTGINIVLGGSWWAFWPLMVTGAVLAVHYFFYKAIAVDRRWVDERVEELNLKSYDRSHIEDLKSRYGGGNEPGDSRR